MRRGMRAGWYPNDFRGRVQDSGSTQRSRMTSAVEQPLHPPRIAPGGARLRPLKMDDAEALYAYLRDPVVTELTSFPAMSMSFVEAMIERSRSRWAAGEPSRWGVALDADDELVG